MDQQALRGSFKLGPLESAVQARLAQLDRQEFCKRLWARDASLWKSEPNHQRVIQNSLGWLTVVADTQARLDELAWFALEARAAGFQDAVVLGMGGSSLCPDVCRATFGTAPGFLRLHVLDSTVPAAVARLEESIDLARTLFLVSSKSGGTIETLSFCKYFQNKVRGLKGEHASENFVAITDPGTSLEKLALEQKFRRIFHGHPDIGGRYSALSNFGMVPAALAGVDIGELLARAEEMAEACGATVPASQNPGIALGAVLAETARAGRDKLTLVVSSEIRLLGGWLEQLIAESTGKEGKGILPILGDKLPPASACSADRVFVSIQLASDLRLSRERELNRLAGAGHPVMTLTLRDATDLGQEFFRWEMATATAGALLGIDPFDQPDVAESKENTARLLAEFRAAGQLREKAPVAESARLAFYADAGVRTALESGGGAVSPIECLGAFLAQVRLRDYMALLAFVERSDEAEAYLRLLQMRLSENLRIATTMGYGPRYLHSTGQLHKGGPECGLFILLTADDLEDRSIPGEDYSFSMLKHAQAIGDLRALEARGRRVIRCHLKGDLQRALEDLLNVAEAALKAARPPGASSDLR